MSFAKGAFALILLASSVIGCKPDETTTPLNDLNKATVPSAFNGAKAGDQRTVARIKLCWCPPGEFTMGSPVRELERRPDEDQVHVTLTKGFWMGKGFAQKLEAIHERLR